MICPEPLKSRIRQAVAFAGLPEPFDFRMSAGGTLSVWLPCPATDPVEAMAINAGSTIAPIVADPESGRLARRIVLSPADWADPGRLASSCRIKTRAAADQARIRLCASGMVSQGDGLALGRTGRLVLAPEFEPARLVVRIAPSGLVPEPDPWVDPERASGAIRLLLQRSGGMDGHFHRIHTRKETERNGCLRATERVALLPRETVATLGMLKAAGDRLLDAADEDRRILDLWMTGRVPDMPGMANGRGES